MSLTLPPVGTNALLEQISDYVPDGFIAELLARAITGGRRHDLSAPQLWRVPLLAGLTTTRSLNLLVAQLPEQPAWRRFARLRRQLPTARMLHEFRRQVGVSGLLLPPYVSPLQIQCPHPPIIAGLSEQSSQSSPVRPARRG